jgi:Zn-dependent protease with chaperone function
MSSRRAFKAQGRTVTETSHGMAFASPTSLRLPRVADITLSARRLPSPACASAGAQTTRVRFPGLRAARFQHPVDVQATRAMRLTRAFEPALRAALAAAEAAMALEQVAYGVRVTPEQLPDVHARLRQACTVLDMDVPDLYVKQSPVPNAYTLAVQGKQPFIVVHSSLIELLEENELQAVLAHECGHLKAEHGLWVTMANLILMVSTSVFGPGIGETLAELGNAHILRWLRAAELTCDRAALLVVQDPNVVMSALMKLAGGSPKYSAKMNVDAYLQQAEAFDKAASTNLGKFVARAMMQGLTHPFPVLRVRELKKWSSSNHFRTLISKGMPLLDSDELILPTRADEISPV